MKTTTQNYQSIDVTLSKSDVMNNKLDEEKVNKVFGNNLIHIIRVPADLFSEYQNSDIKKLLYPHLQNKCKVVYYTEILDSNNKPKIQSFSPVYY